ncbi:hypothetical protein, partial [Pseudovibrio flavus]|uniref:hypothetical protein n=1 Tax=Pseudovibrio flavus TaxID=2529854 RepID=UPI00211CA984
MCFTAKKIALLSSTALLGTSLLLASSIMLPSLSEAQAADCTYVDGDAAKPGCFYDGTADSTIKPDAGGYLMPSALNNNKVTVTGAGTTVAKDAYGGFSGKGITVAGNKLIIEAEAIVTGIANGGNSSGGTATDNTVTVTGAGTEVKGLTIGGWGESANNNTVNVEAGATVSDVFGGSSHNGDATGNTVNITGSNTAVKSGVAGGSDSGEGRAWNNAVTISEGAQIGGAVTGGNIVSGAGESYANTVTISGRGTVVSGNVIGGKTNSGNTFATFNGKVVGNSVIISGGTINGEVIGGVSSAGNAKYNTVTISGGILHSDIYGGKTDADAATCSNCSATGNTVTYNGGMIRGNIYGGQAKASLDQVRGNTLNVQSKLTMQSGKTVGNFETYNFHIGSDVLAGNTMLQVYGTEVDLNSGNVKSKVNITSIAADTSLREGDIITLISDTKNADKTIIEGVETPTVGNPTTASVESGISTIYEF